MAAVLTRNSIKFVREGETVGETVLLNVLNAEGNPLDGIYLTGTKIQPVAFSGDLSRSYVGGNGVVYVIDMVTYKLIDTIAIPAGKNVTSLVSAGSVLIIGEGLYFGYGASGSRLMAMDIEPGSKNYNKIVTLKDTGVEQTPMGVSGMTIGPDGQTLVVGVPVLQNNTMGLSGANRRGNILIFDLKSLDIRTGKLDAPIKAELPDDGISGKTPQVITATGDPDRYLVADVSDYNRGLATLVLTRDAQDKITAAKLTAIRMFQPNDAIRIDRLDIQRAQSAVLVEQDGVEYAIVSDDNYHFLDPHWKAMYEAPDFLFTPFGPPVAYGGSASAKKVAVGGKLGIMFDPEVVVGAVEGRMGDVVEVDLKTQIADWAARELLGWPSAAALPESAMSGDERLILRSTRARWQ